jgi:uncharacterized protein
MKLLIDLTHPAHVHFFKHAAKTWQNHGHQVAFVAREKEITIDLLNAYQIPYQQLSRIRKGLLGLGIELIEHQAGLVKFARDFQPDLMLNIGGTFIVHAGKLLGIKTCVFSDTEHAKLSNHLTFPFATWICTPQAFYHDLGSKQIRYNGYQELAYLHPNYFTPDPEVLRDIGLDPKERFFLLRFVSWGASHDVGKLGLSDNEKLSLVKHLQPHGRVIISSEMTLPDALEPYRMSLSPTRIHDLLYYASLYVGEGATMAAEAAILGTPSFYVNVLTAGTLDELEHQYRLISKIKEIGALKETIHSFLKREKEREEFQFNHEQMLQDKIDVTAWLVDFVETLSLV